MKVDIRRHRPSTYLFLLMYIVSVFSLGNPLAKLNFLPSIINYVVIAILSTYCLLSCLHYKTLPISLFPAIFIFALSILPSVLHSIYFDISLLKYLIFFSAIIFITYISSKLRQKDTVEKTFIYRSFLKINRIFLFLSLVIFLLGLGYPANETGFAGILNQPQAFGVFLVLLTVIELFGLVLKITNSKWAYFSIGLTFLFALTTESRLAIITLTIILTMYVFMFVKIRIRNVIFFILLSIVSIVSLNQITDRVSYTLSKSGRSQATGLQALDKTRGDLARGSLRNFSESPYFGIGFQVSNGLYGTKPMQVKRSTKYKIPTTASIEKGVFWTALFEEVGLVGVLGFLAFIVSYFLSLPVKFRVIIISSFFLIGFGEAFYFSLGGIGLLFWNVAFLFYIMGNLNNPYLQKNSNLT